MQDGGGGTKSYYAEDRSPSSKSSLDHDPTNQNVTRRIGGTKILLPLASHISAQPATGYVDNTMNCRLGRVGKLYGTHVCHTDGTITIFDPSKDKTPTRIYDDIPENRQLQRVGKPVTTPFPCSFYVDNAMNRRLGRVGQRYSRSGLHVLFYSDDPSKEGEKVEKKDLPRAKLDSSAPSDVDFAKNLTSHAIIHIDQAEEYAAAPPADNKIHLQVVPSEKDDSPGPPERIQLFEVHIPRERGNVYPHIPRVKGDIYIYTLIPGVKGDNTYTGTWKGHSTTFKKFNVSLTLTKSEKWRAKVKNEMKSLYNLVHPSIANIYGAVLDIGNIGIVMAYYPCTLFRAIFVEEQDFPEHQKTTIMRQIAEGVLFLHNHGVALCTLSSGTIHLSNYGCAKIESFGPKMLTCDIDCLRDHVDERYAAPEITQNRFITADQVMKADIYSLATVMYELFESKVAEKDPPARLRGHNESATLVPFSIFTILTHCWDDSPDNRPEAAVLFSHLQI